MPLEIINNTDFDSTELEQHVQGMYNHFDERIGFSRPPRLFLDSDPSNASNTLGKTAYYNPQAFEVHIFVDGRHPKDMLRSIAHELIHHQQNLEGRLDVGGYQGEGYYLKNKEMKILEDEAMLNGNIFLREYEDKLKLEENNTMSIKQWKNKELFESLAERWGFGTKVLNEGQSVRKGTKDRNVGRERMRPDRQHEELELEEANYSATPAAMAAYVKLKGLEGDDIEGMYTRSLNNRELLMPTEEERAEMKKMMELDESSTMAGGDVAGAAAAVAPEANESLEQTLREAVRSVLSNNKELIKRLTK
jgi:hypothetical protein